jgi:V/A-type H+-transporting ATPase subunit I
MPVPRVRTGNKSISELEDRLEEVEIELEDLQAERAGLTRWCSLFAGNIDRLEDHAAVDEAIQQTHEEDPIFALQAWAPEENTAELDKYAKDKGIVFVATDPAPEETPPTIMRNPEGLAVGQDLVSFYITPKYWLWDPSIIVFFSFALFFAMIFADAGYSATLGLILAAIWKRMGQSAAGRRFRILMATLVGVGVAYGILVGSYFGVSPGEGTFMARLKILDVMDFNVMMKLSILLGVFHLVLANTLTAWHWRRSPRAVVPAAWIFIFIGAVLIWLASGSALITVGIAAMGLGVAGILFFTSVEGPIWKRLLQGLLGLTRFSNAFGDSLSYLRLFALGLASASLAGTFNDLSGQVKAAVPGIGLLFALLIVLLGHGLNFVLSLSSGVIHGMRLNCIEFFNWSISEEGYPFKAFDRKEKKSWKA